MKVVSLQFPPTDEEYRANITRQKMFARKIVAKARAGGNLSETELSFVASALDIWAESLSEVRPKPKNRPPKINHSDVACDFVLLRQSGISGNKAKGKLAEFYNVDVDTIRNAIEKKLNAAEALYGAAQERK